LPDLQQKLIGYCFLSSDKTITLHFIPKDADIVNPVSQRFQVGWSNLVDLGPDD
jgi:hypothetical protein